METPNNDKVAAIEALVGPFYEGKDTMHNLSHIRRLLRGAQELAKVYAPHADGAVILYGAYMHGLNDDAISSIRDFFASLSPETVQRILLVARESQKEELPSSLEGRILHDAHLLEGGRTFLIVKSLVTGSARGQTLEETLAFIENHVLGKFTCYLPEAQALYDEKEAFARALLDELKAHL